MGSTISLLGDDVDDGEVDRGGLFLVFFRCGGVEDDGARGGEDREGVIPEEDDKLDLNCSTRSTLGLYDCSC